MSRADSPLRGRVIFNFGSRRSGTYWLQRIVTATPAVSAVPTESYLFSHGIAPLYERFQHSARASQQVGTVYVDREPLVEATRDLCDVVLMEHLEAGADRVAERTPHHARHLPLITEVYPDARYVHIIRDGRDVARSIAAQDWGPESIAEAAAEWRDSVATAQTASLDPAIYREVRYERLLASPREEIAALYEWLGLQASAAALGEAVAEAERQVNVDWRSGNVGTAKWREAFSPDDLEVFDTVAGDLLEELGYDRKATALGRRRGGSGLGGALRKRIPRRSERARETDVVQAGDVNRVLTLLRERDLDALERTLTESALVRVVSAGGTQEARAAAGRELLARTLMNDELLSGRQVRGDVFRSHPTHGAIVSATANGVEGDRAVFVTFREERVEELVLYQLPLARAAA